MPRPAGFAVALILAVLVAGCGGDDDGGPQIPQGDAEALIATAQEIEDASAAQECPEAQAATTDLRAQVDALEGEVGSEIYDALSQMVSRLDEELGIECTDEGTTDTEEETTEEPVEPVEPEPTTTTTTTTQPPEDDEGEEPQEEAPPEEPSGEGGGSQGPGPPVSPPGQSGSGPPTGGIEEDDG